MEPSTRAGIDADAAAALGVSVDLLHTAAVHVRPSPRPDDSIVLFRLTSAVVVLVPSGEVERAGDLVDGRAPDEVFTPTFAAELGGPGGTVFGPSLHSYVDGTCFRGVAHPRVDRLEPTDPRLLDLRDRCGLADWSEGGFTLDPAPTDPATTALYGLAERGALVAAGNMTPWRGHPLDVGLVTRPDRRGEGLGAAVAATMTAAWLPLLGVVRYRALVTNAASFAVATRLGFERYGANLLVRRR